MTEYDDIAAQKAEVRFYASDQGGVEEAICDATPPRQSIRPKAPCR